MVGGNTTRSATSFFIYRFIDDFLISVDKVVYVQNNAGISLLILLLLLLLLMLLLMTYLMARGLPLFLERGQPSSRSVRRVHSLVFSMPKNMSATRLSRSPSFLSCSQMRRIIFTQADRDRIDSFRKANEKKVARSARHTRLYDTHLNEGSSLSKEKFEYRRRMRISVNACCVCACACRPAFSRRAFNFELKEIKFTGCLLPEKTWNFQKISFLPWNQGKKNFHEILSARGNFWNFTFKFKFYLFLKTLFLWSFFSW